MLEMGVLIECRYSVSCSGGGFDKSRMNKPMCLSSHLQGGPFSLHTGVSGGAGFREKLSGPEMNSCRPERFFELLNL